MKSAVSLQGSLGRSKGCEWALWLVEPPHLIATPTGSSSGVATRRTRGVTSQDHWLSIAIGSGPAARSFTWPLGCPRPTTWTPRATPSTNPRSPILRHSWKPSLERRCPPEGFGVTGGLRGPLAYEKTNEKQIATNSRHSFGSNSLVLDVLTKAAKATQSPTKETHNKYTNFMVDGGDGACQVRLYVGRGWPMISPVC